MGAAAENAFNQYIRANATWSKCIESLSCSTKAVEPKLQKFWSKAGDSIDDADAGLVSMSEGNAPAS